MTESSADYTKQFEFQTLPKIHGEPDYDQLKNMKDKLKTNATKIPSDLGGGAFGHLGLVLTPAEYANISAVPYIRPIHPGVLNLPAPASERTEKRRRDQHKKDLATYHETIHIENALKKQISETVDELYLEELRDPTTNTILHDIPTILRHLLTNYGEIDPDGPTDKESQIRKMAFTIADPLTKLYKEVEDLEQLSIAANSRYTRTQLINIALQVIKGTNDYTRALEDWYCLPLLNQTWINLKSHFQEARRTMKKVRGKTMKDAGFNSINIITEDIKEVKDSLNAVQASVLDALADNHSVMSHVANNISQQHYHDGRFQFVPPELITEDNTPPLEHSVNSTITSSSDIASILKNLSQEIATLKSDMVARSYSTPYQPSFPGNTDQQFDRYQPFNTGGRGGGRGGRGGRGRGNRGGRGRGRGGRGRGTTGQPRQRTNVSQYCWSHGACGHPSWFCENPQPGHQYQATFENKLNGSTYYCPA